MWAKYVEVNYHFTSTNGHEEQPTENPPQKRIHDLCVDEDYFYLQLYIAISIRQHTINSQSDNTFEW